SADFVRLTCYAIGDHSIVTSIRIESQHSVDDPWILVFQNFNVMAEDSKLWGMVIFIFNGAQISVLLEDVHNDPSKDNTGNTPKAERYRQLRSTVNINQQLSKYLRCVARKTAITIFGIEDVHQCPYRDILLYAYYNELILEGGGMVVLVFYINAKEDCAVPRRALARVFRNHPEKIMRCRFIVKFLRKEQVSRGAVDFKVSISVLCSDTEVARELLQDIKRRRCFWGRTQTSCKFITKDMDEGCEWYLC
ncbi:hypothetical protein U0070_027229, partial [Myodes glareolus]